MKRVIAIAAAALFVFIEPLAAADCSNSGVGVQVLGSGGPIADSARASSGTLVWINGYARVLVDAGGSVFLRYGESGAKVEDLDLIAITHLHTYHVSDLAALLKGAIFSSRSRVLPVSGPSGDKRFPSLVEFLDAKFGAKAGAFRYLSGLLDGSGDSFQLRPVQTNTARFRPTTVLDSADLRVQAISVPHSAVPALGYRIDTGGFSIVVGGDQNGSNPRSGGSVDVAADLARYPLKSG